MFEFCCWLLNRYYHSNNRKISNTQTNGIIGCMCLQMKQDIFFINNGGFKLSRRKIKLATPEDITDFVNMCSKYECDVNIYDGRNVIDAKSIIGVFSIPQGKVIEVQVVTHDEDVVTEFLENIRKYEV